MAAKKRRKDKYDVLAIGNAIVDVLAEVDASFLQEFNLVTGTMALVNEETAGHIHAKMQNHKTVSGGSAANTAVALAMLEGKAAFIGKVADDALGKAFAADIKQIGVHYSTEPSQSGATTAVSHIMITPDHQRTMATYLGATRNLTKDDIDEELVKQAKVIFIEGYLWDEDNAKTAILHAIDLAKQHNKKIAFSLSDVFCIERHREEFLSLIKNHVDLLFANEAELFSLFKGSEGNTEDLINIVHKQWECERVVVTKSERGSCFAANGEIHKFPAFVNIDVLDVTGAGDFYAAGHLYAYCHDYSIKHTGRLATFAARDVITQIGARPKKPLAYIKESIKVMYVIKTPD